MSRVDTSPAAVSARLRQLGQLSDLRAGHRLRTKVDMSPSAVSQRMRILGQALELCQKLAARRRA